MADATLVDLVKITALTTGTGAITLGDAVPGYRGQEALLDGAIYGYSIQQEAEYEIGRCTYLLASRQIVRTPEFSSNGGPPINLQANASIAFVATAEDILGRDVLRPLYGYGAPTNNIGLIGQTYTDKNEPVTLYGPKTATGWGVGVVLSGSPGNDGNTGPANSTFISLALLKAAPVTNASYIFAPPGGTEGGTTAGTFLYQTAGAPYTADDANVIKLDAVPLTTGALIRQGAAGITYGKSVNIALPLDKSLPRTAGYFGVDPFTTASQHSKLEQMFAAASNDGLFLNLHPDAKYRKDGPLRLAGNARLDGQGATLMPLSDGPQALVAGVGLPLAPGFTLMNLRLLGASTTRTSNPGDNGIFLGDVGQPVVTDFLLFNIEIGSVDDPTSSTARGVGAAAFYFGNAQRGRIAQCRAIRSKADGFHVVHGSKDLQFDQPFAYAVGDDSFAVISYVSGGALSERLLWNQPVSINGGARVCSVVGGRDVVFDAPIGLNSAAAGVYFASEDSFDTLGVDNCHVKRGTFIGACQGSAATGPNFRQAGTLLLGRAGSDTVAGEVISRSVQRCSIEATIRGDGPSMTVAHDCQSLYNSKNKIDLQAYNTTAAGALAIGGQDTEIRFRGGNIGGLLGFIGQGTRGVLELDVDCDGSRIAGTSPQNVNIFVQGNGSTEVRLTGDIRGGPAQFFGGDGFDFSKLYWRDVLFNGGRQLDRNIQVGAISYATGWSSSSNHPVRIERDPAGTAILSGEFTGGTTSAGTLVATLPGGYAPTEPTRQPVANADGTVGAVSVATNGAITILAGVTGAFQINLPIRTGRA